MGDLTKTPWRSRVGRTGEAAAKQELEDRGWTVTDLNFTQRNTPNVDLAAQKGDRIVNIQVKTYNKTYGWIWGGSVTPAICAGGPLFNKKKRATYCDFVICVPPASLGDKGKTVREDWRFFVMPVNIADNLFRININAYFNTPKKNGGVKVQKGAVQDFVGPGCINSTVVPDHQEDYHPYEKPSDSGENYLNQRKCEAA